MKHGDSPLFWRLLRSKAVWATGLFLFLFWLNNTSSFVDTSGRKPIILAHGALGQTYDLEGVRWNTNTAAIIHEPEHLFIENTIPSIRVAFDFGADIVELDVRMTADNRLAVFHDDTLEYRTDGKGYVVDHTMNELRQLDVGYGYTADNGRTYPLRGTGVGLLPNIDEVLRAFPNRSFLIHIKDGGDAVGPLLLDFLCTLDRSTINNLSVYGNDHALDLLKAHYPEIKTLTKQRMVDALLRYVLVGWTGFVPDAMRNMELHLPEEYAGLLWGWPNRFLQRMEQANTRVVLVQYVNGWSDGFNTPADLAKLPDDFTGGVWTNRIDVIGPLLKE